MNRQQRVFVALLAIVFFSPAMADERSRFERFGRDR